MAWIMDHCTPNEDLPTISKPRMVNGQAVADEYPVSLILKGPPAGSGHSTRHSEEYGGAITLLITQLLRSVCECAEGRVSTEGLCCCAKPIGGKAVTNAKNIAPYRDYIKKKLQSIHETEPNINYQVKPNDNDDVKLTLSYYNNDEIVYTLLPYEPSRLDSSAPDVYSDITDASHVDPSMLISGLCKIKNLLLKCRAVDI